MIPLLLDNEVDRLGDLHRYAILDTGPEAAYDDLVQLAATVCHAPAAMIVFIDADRLWFKAQVGLAELPSARAAGNPCECTIAMREPVFVVEDTVRDPRFACLVDREPPIRFYAGAPLVTPDGHALGCLCVLDHVPRRLNAEQREGLCGLARQVMTHLELRRKARELAETVEELRVAERTIRHLAFHDALTGLPGRLLFNDRMGHAISRAKRYDQALAVMFLDLDGFKKVNDTWGHAVGDRLLCAVGERLRGALRHSDTVARMGGDEFAILCPDLRGLEDAEVLARKILATFTRPCKVDGLSLPITASVGIALYPYDGATPETLLVDADTAMYRAKRLGKNTYTVCPLANVKSCIRGETGS